MLFIIYVYGQGFEALQFTTAQDILMVWSLTLTTPHGTPQLARFYHHNINLEDRKVLTICTLCRSCATEVNPQRHGPLISSVMSTIIIGINPRRACARVTVLVLSVCLCVCVSVCFPYSGTSRNPAYKQQYQRLQHDTGMKYKKGFFFKTLRSEVMASFTHLE